jgi:hypothetical protein
LVMRKRLWRFTLELTQASFEACICYDDFPARDCLLLPRAGSIWSSSKWN